MIDELYVHVHILILEKYMNYMFGNDWAKDVVFLIVKMINDQHVDADCGDNYTIILKNGNLSIYCSQERGDHNNIIVPNPIKRDVGNVLKIGCCSYYTNYVVDYGLYEFDKRHRDQNWGVTMDELCIDDKCKFITTNFSEIVCGSHHTFCVLKDGSLYGYGHNCCGELGLGDYDHFNGPKGIGDYKFRTLVKLNLVVNRVFTKFSHSFAFTKDGRVLGWGCNDNGQLGRDGACDIPQKLMLLGVIYVCCSFFHSLVIVKSNNLTNKIYICGKIEHYDVNFGVNLKNGDVFIRKLMVGCDWIHHIVSMVCGMCETMTLTNNGNVYCWSNDYCLNSDNYVNTEYLPVKVNICNVRLIKSGNNHNIFVTRSDEIFYRDSVDTYRIKSGQYEDSCGAQRILRIEV